LYRLTYSLDLISWFEIRSFFGSKENETLCVFDAENILDGTYYLRLESFVSQNLFYEYGSIRIVNTEISKPFDLNLYSPFIYDNKVIWNSYDVNRN
jgi:hypothetical protein